MEEGKQMYGNNSELFLRYEFSLRKILIFNILLFAVVLPVASIVSAENIQAETNRTHLILGGTGGSPDEAFRCKFNSKLYWGGLLDAKNNISSPLRNFLDSYKSVGIEFFFIHGFAKSEKNLFKYEMIDGNKMKFFKYPYSLSSGSEYMEGKKAIIENELNVLKENKFSGSMNIVLNPYSDEVYYANAHLNYLFHCELTSHMAYYCNAPIEKKTFEKETKLTFPTLTPSRLLKKNTIQNREYILFRYRTSAKAFAAWQRQIKDALPDMKIYITMNLPEVYGLERYPSGIALDMALEYGFSPDYVSATAFQNSYDWRGPDTHYYPVEVLKHLMAAFPASKVFIFTSQMVWQKDTSHHGDFVRYEEFPPTMETHEVYGLNAMLVGHGASGVLPFAGGDFKRTSEIHQMALGWCYDFLRRISPWIKDAVPYTKTALLYSRASEDFWSLANEDPKLNEIADGSLSMRNMQCIQDANYISYHQNVTNEKSRGFRAHKNVMHYLLKNGILFDLVFLDSLQEGALDKYDSAIMPFPYSLNRTSCEILENFVKNKGKQLVICEMLGETDEKGNSNKVPFLAEFLTEPNVLYVNDSFNTNPENAISSADVKKILAAGKSTSCVLSKKDKSEVETALLRKNSGDAILFLMNWTDAPAGGTVELPWLDGEVQLERISLSQNGNIKKSGMEKSPCAKIEYNLERHQLQAIRITK